MLDAIRREAEPAPNTEAEDDRDHWEIDRSELEAAVRPILDPNLLSAYQQDGFVRIKGALTKLEVEGLRAAIETQRNRLSSSAGAYDFQAIADQIWGGARSLDTHEATRFDMTKFMRIIESDPSARSLQDSPDDGAPQGCFFYEAAGWRQFPEIRHVALDSILPELVASLLETSYVNFWEDTTFVKTAGATQRTAFHQDLNYFQIAGRKCCIIWIALDDATEETGALEYIRGSHLWKDEYAPNLLISGAVIPESQGVRLPDIEADRSSYEIVSVPADAGDIIIHDVRIIHGSSGNRTRDKMRRAISLRYCGDDITYCDKPGAIRQPWVAEPPKNGEFLYSPDYPRVWPRPFPGARLSNLYNTE